MGAEGSEGRGENRDERNAGEGKGTEERGGEGLLAFHSVHPKNLRLWAPMLRIIEQHVEMFNKKLHSMFHYSQDRLSWRTFVETDTLKWGDNDNDEKTSDHTIITAHNNQCYYSPF